MHSWEVLVKILESDEAQDIVVDVGMYAAVASMAGTHYTQLQWKLIQHNAAHLAGQFNTRT